MLKELSFDLKRFQKAQDLVPNMDFDLKRFQKAQNLVQNMRDEFCIVAERKIRKMDYFVGQYVRRQTGAGAEKVEEDVFLAKSILKIYLLT